MRRFALYSLVVLLAGLAVPGQAFADDIKQVGTVRRGKLGFVFAGASMTESDGLDNGVHCLKTEASVEIYGAQLPSRPRLVQATLYVGGTLIGGDVDLQSPGGRIFDDGLLIWDNPAHQEELLALARNEADRTVRFRPPGATDFIEVTAPPDRPKVVINYTPAGPELGNVATFVTPIDVTELVRNSGSRLDGTYTVADLRADVCRGLEAVCDEGQATPSCTVLSATHTKAAASFGLLLIFEDPSLPLSSIALFEGMQQLNGSSLSLNLAGGISISDPPAGALAFYALEGDLGIGAPVTPQPPCDGEEYIIVQGKLDPDAPGLCLEDTDNPIGNIFNSTINTTPRTEPPGFCNRPSYQCCVLAGLGQCGETGVDIDTFDISGALEAGATAVSVRLGTDSDSVNLAAVVLDVDIFEPVLNLDSQIRILSEKTDDGFVRLGVPLELSVVVSNTGNVPATDVTVVLDAPPFTGNLRVVNIPADGLDQSSAGGGLSGTGQVRVSDFFIPQGEAREIRLQLDTICPEAVGRDLRVQANISSAELAQFSIDGPRAVGAGPGVGACEGLDLGGPFAQPVIYGIRELAGGGGCAAVSGSGLLALALAAGLASRRRRRGGRS